MSAADIVFDSNVLTFFLDANRGEYTVAPSDPLREERIAAFRLFLYCRPFIVRTVATEAGRIRNGPKLKEHMASVGTNFAECLPDDDQIEAIERRARSLEPHHRGQMDDCRIVAETELCGVPALVTFDTRLRKALSPQTKIRIQTPGRCWQSLAIPRGTAPQWSPAHGHPLATETWWRWE
jgi:hypothetical protein